MAAESASLAVAVGPEPPGTDSLTFDAMGTSVHVLVVGGPVEMTARARQRIDDLEARWSRFRPDSEISRLNAAAGVALDVSPETVLLLELAHGAWRSTSGLYDPTVLPALRAAGYDRTFDDVAPDAAVDPDDPAPGPAPGLDGLELDRAAQQARLPIGVEFDPGGIGKGLAADLVVAELLDAGADGALVNLGGDLRVAGTSPDGDGWGVEVEAPDGTPAAQLALRAGAVATSTPLRRRWRRGGQVRHHLIDPATGRPAARLPAAVTVVAGEAWRAEVLAKAVLLADPIHRSELLLAWDAAALVQPTDDDPVALAGVERFLR